MTSTLFAVLDLLAYGSDTVTIHQLFKVASALDPNPVHHTSLNDLVASLRRNNMGTFIDSMTRGSKICLLAEPVDNSRTEVGKTTFWLHFSLVI